jgi:hypothetical protein
MVSLEGQQVSEKKMHTKEKQYHQLAKLNKHLRAHNILPPVLYIWRTGIFHFGHNIRRSGDTESKLISVQFKRMARNEACMHGG